MNTYTDRETALILFRLVNGVGDNGSEHAFDCLSEPRQAGWMALAVYGKMRGLEYYKQGLNDAALLANQFAEQGISKDGLTIRDIILTARNNKTEI